MLNMTFFFSFAKLCRAASLKSRLKNEDLSAVEIWLLLALQFQIAQPAAQTMLTRLQCPQRETCLTLLRLQHQIHPLSLLPPAASSKNGGGGDFTISPSRESSTTRLTLTDLRVTGEDAAVRTRAAASQRRGNPVK